MAAGDFVIQCTDGFICICDAGRNAGVSQSASIGRGHAEHGSGLCLARGAEDNVSVQVARIDRVEKVTYYRGNPIYTEGKSGMGQEIQVGQVLDERFRDYVEVISRSGMASYFLGALDRQLGTFVRVEGPVHAVRK